MNLPTFMMFVAAAFALGAVCATLLERQPEPTPIDPKKITLLSMAIRLRYLSHEGTLSKTGNTVRFDAEGSESANDFIDAIMAIVEAAE